MPKLILDDAGSKRAFRLGDGRLTIGSGAGDKLRLTADGVEEGHVVLHVRGGRVTFDALGPVVVGGEELEGEGHQLRTGQTLHIGDARLAVAAEEPASKAPAGAKAPERPSTRDASDAPPPRRRGSAAGGRRSSGGRRAPVKFEGEIEVRASLADRHRHQSSMPGWVVPVGVIVVLAGAIGAYQLIGGGPAEPATLLAEVEIELNEGRVETAKEKLSLLKRDKLSSNLKTRYDEMVALASTVQEGNSARIRRNEGLRFADQYLIRYSEKYLVGSDLDPGKLSMWFENLAEFRRQHPNTSSAVWMDNADGKQAVQAIAALEASFAGKHDPSAPATMADALWWREYYTSGGKDGSGAKLFGPVLAKIDEVLPSLGEDERGALESIREEVLADREVYVGQRMAKAKELFDRYRESNVQSDLMNSAAQLVNLIHNNRDATIRNQVGNVLAGYPQDKLRSVILASYQQHEPTKYASLMEVPVIASIANAPVVPGTE